MTTEAREFIDFWAQNSVHALHGVHLDWVPAFVIRTVNQSRRTWSSISPNVIFCDLAGDCALTSAAPPYCVRAAQVPYRVRGLRASQGGRRHRRASPSASTTYAAQQPSLL